MKYYHPPTNAERHTERERKFRVLNFRPEFIPPDAELVDIEQSYLLDVGKTSRRVRKSLVEGRVFYTYTEKTSVGIPGERDEYERPITEEEYRMLLLKQDPATRVVRKTRSCFMFAGKLIEFDTFYEPVPGLYVAEIELNGWHESIELPPEWDFVEVTADKRYTNHAIAQGRLPWPY